MERRIHSRFICILLTVSMLVFGVFCGEAHTDSPFSHSSNNMSTAVIQPVGRVFDTQVYYEKNTLNLVGDYILTRQSVRTTTTTRVSPLFITPLFVITIYLILLSFRNSFLCTDAYENQYSQRTLEYIHQNDGKKA